MALALDQLDFLSEITKVGYTSFFLLWGGTCSLHMPVLRPASQAGPMHNPRDGTTVV